MNFYMLLTLLITETMKLYQIKKQTNVNIYFASNNNLVILLKGTRIWARVDLF